MDYRKCKKFIKRLKKIEKISDPDESAQALSELTQEMRHNDFEFPLVYRHRIAEIRQLIEEYATRTVSKKRYQTNTFKGAVIALVVTLLGGGIPAWFSLYNKTDHDSEKVRQLEEQVQKAKEMALPPLANAVNKTNTEDETAKATEKKAKGIRARMCDIISGEFKRLIQKQVDPWGSFNSGKGSVKTFDGKSIFFLVTSLIHQQEDFFGKVILARLLRMLLKER